MLSLNRRTRCCCSPCACQMRSTELTLLPTALAIMPAVLTGTDLPDEALDEILAHE